MALARKFVCKFCTRAFTRKSWFDRHKCEKRKRFEEKNDIHVIAARRLFNHWQRRTGLLRRGKEKTIAEFLKSPYYNAFKNLATYTTNNRVVSAYKYVDWLVDNSIPDSRWCSQPNLDEYKNYLRETEDPGIQADTSLRNILEWCEDKNVLPENFFASITPGQALNMVRSNQLCPWVLFGYDSSMIDLVERIRDGGETWRALDDHINVRYWLEKVGKDTDSRERVNAHCSKVIEASQ